jgi:hypothetical protein
MKHTRHFGIIGRASVREADCIGTMIADMRRVLQILDCDVQTEEERARIFDRSDANYPMLARTLAARRENLKMTIAALEMRLSSIDAPPPASFTIAA